MLEKVLEEKEFSNNGERKQKHFLFWLKEDKNIQATLH
jgi:hypothetical protein